MSVLITPRQAIEALKLHVLDSISRSGVYGIQCNTVGHDLDFFEDLGDKQKGRATKVLIQALLDEGLIEIVPGTGTHVFFKQVTK